MSFAFFHTSLYWTDGEKKTKAKKVTGKGKKKKKKSNDEALEDSDDGDYEGLEVDYMSDESRSDQLHCCAQRLFLDPTMHVWFMFILLSKSSSDEEPEKGKPSKGEDHPKGQTICSEHYRPVSY